MLTGYLQKTICWLLMEEGQITREGLCQFVDAHKYSISGTLADLVARDVVQQACLPNARGRKVMHFGLTRKGIEGAKHISKAEIQPYLRSKHDRDYNHD
jgi:predicted ArsR family transcriptional regulator